ncbi:MAG: metal ABC transporter permease [Actinomycetes bacterium]
MNSFPSPQLSWNVIADVRALLEYPFMVQAFRAGIIVAILAGIVGWFMVLRRQSFAGHTLAVVGFPGATAAVLIGVSSTYGFYAFSVAAALVIAMLANPGGSRTSESAVVGTVQAFALAFGFLCYTLYGGFASSIGALLFGSFLGITSNQVAVLAAVTLAVVAGLAAIGRPLYFATVDPDVALANGVPLRTLSTFYLIILGLTAGAVSQITGALLVFALLVAPAAAAQRLSLRPLISLAWSVVLAVAIVVTSLSLAYYYPYPLGTFVTTIALVTYLIVRVVRQ